jgi:hypothetical protein
MSPPRDPQVIRIDGGNINLGGLVIDKLGMKDGELAGRPNRPISKCPEPRTFACLRYSKMLSLSNLPSGGLRSNLGTGLTLVPKNLDWHECARGISAMYMERARPHSRPLSLTNIPISSPPLSPRSNGCQVLLHRAPDRRRHHLL